MKDKVAIITGGSSGIGKAIAQQLIKAGCIVVNADINEPGSDENSKCFFYKTDLTNVEDVQQLYNYVIDTVGFPDILISNAGRGIHEKLEEGDPEKWKNIIDINLLGALRFLRSFLPGLLNKGTGDVVIISSVAARQTYEYGGVYSASKAALDTIAETLRLEAGDKARVCLVSPGVVDTSFFTNMESGELSVESIGFGSLNPQSVADAVVFALSRPPGQAIHHITLRPIRQRF